MKTIVYILAALILSIFAIEPAGAIAQSASTGSIAGKVLDVSGTAIADAKVQINGPVAKQTSSDAQGAFSFSGLPAGLYRIDVNKPGYALATSDIAVIAGESTPVTASLQHLSLGSLRTIASVSTSAHGSINTGAASTTYISSQQFTTLANPQINAVLQRIPGAVIERGSSSPNTSISLGGSQSYETQTLLDGHPLSAGRYGVWFSQFFPSWMLQSVETEVGPGNTTPFAGTALGGTANLVTRGFTAKPTFEFVDGIDSYQSQYSHFLTTGSLGDKLKYVFGLGYGSNNGPYYGTYGCVVQPNSPAKDNQPGSTGIIQFCGDNSGSLFNKGELLKLRYDFSKATSFEAGFEGAQSGYSPQGSAYGQYAGNMTIVPCLSNGTSCTNPNDNQYVGKTISGLIYYPGSNVYNNQPLFTGELRTTIGDNTLLIRPYAGNIGRIIDGSGESKFPQFYFPVGSSTKVCTGAPAYGIVGATQGNMVECLQGPFSVLEFDKLKGGTLSFVHPFGANTIDAVYDYHSDETFAYYNTPASVVVPDTTAKFSTLSLTGDFPLSGTVTLRMGLYGTNWNLNGIQSIPLPGGKTTSGPLNRSVSRIDPHIALTLQPTNDTSYRVAYGTSATFPYASLVSGTSFITKGSATAPLGTFTEKNPYLSPEVATEFDLGVDHRFHNGGILSVDLASNQIRNVFETISTPAVSPLYSFVNMPVNVANLSAESINLKYAYTPNVGLGYSVAAALSRSIVNGVPDSFYTSPTAYVQPANGQQQCSNGGSQVCIPYLKAYGELEYTLRDRTYFQLGADFEGKNNTYNQPPFIVYNFAARRPLNDRVELQLAVENLLNTNNFQNLPEPNAGVAQVGQSSTGLGSILSPLIPAPPRTLRLQIEYHVGTSPQ